MSLSLKQFIDELASDKEIKMNHIQASENALAKLHAFFLLLGDKVTLNELALNIIMICRVKERYFISEEEVADLITRGVFTSPKEDSDEDSEYGEYNEPNVLITQAEVKFRPILYAMLRSEPASSISLQSRDAWNLLLELHQKGADVQAVVKHAKIMAQDIGSGAITANDVKRAVEYVRRLEREKEDEEAAARFAKRPRR